MKFVSDEQRKAIFSRMGRLLPGKKKRSKFVYSPSTDPHSTIRRINAMQKQRRYTGRMSPRLSDSDREFNGKYEIAAAKFADSKMKWLDLKREFDSKKKILVKGSAERGELSGRLSLARQKAFEDLEEVRKILTQKKISPRKVGEKDVSLGGRVAAYSSDVGDVAQGLAMSNPGKVAKAYEELKQAFPEEHEEDLKAAILDSYRIFNIPIRGTVREREVMSPRSSSCRFDIKELSSDDFYDEYSKYRKTIIPAKAMFEYDSNRIILNKGAVEGREDRAHSILHEIGHLKFGPDEGKAEVYALGRLKYLKDHNKKWKSFDLDKYQKRAGISLRKLKDFSIEEIKTEMDSRKKNAVENYRSIIDDKRWMALLNEYERRVMAMGSKK